MLYTSIKSTHTSPLVKALSSAKWSVIMERASKQARRILAPRSITQELKVPTIWLHLYAQDCSQSLHSNAFKTTIIATHNYMLWI